MGLEPNDILKVDIEQYKHQAEGLRETLSQSMSSLVRMISKEETLFLIEQNFSVTPNDTKLRKGYETSVDVSGIDGERVHEARRGRAQSFYELQNAEVEEYDQTTLKLYKLVDEEIKESYVQYLVADKMPPHSLHPGSEWMFHIQNRLRFPVAVSVKAGLLRNDQIIKNQVTGEVGKPHEGVDFACSLAQPIPSSKAGKVIMAGWQDACNPSKGYGQYVRVDHGGGYVTTYAHLSSINAQVGDQVSAGTVIGGCGSTGTSTGNHRHFEIIINGRKLNPLPFVGG